jgi:tRNA (adenine37-N6)-methyltransferase
MVRENEIREGELAVEMPEANDAGLVFIGRIHTPWTSRLETPRQGRHDGPICRLEIFEPWVPAIKGVDFYSNLEVIYWLDQSRRDLVLQSPKNNKSTRGTFSLRSPVRPNPIGTSIVELVGIEGNMILVRARLPQRHAAARREARPLRIHPARPAAARGFRDGVGGCPVLCHCEERSDEAIQSRGHGPGMPCFVRSDGRGIWRGMKQPCVYIMANRRNGTIYVGVTQTRLAVRSSTGKAW